MKDEAGAGSPSRDSRIAAYGSSWPNGAVFFPPLEPVKWTYPSPKCLPGSPSGRPVRADGITLSIATLRQPLHGFCSDNSPVVLLWSSFL